MSEPATVTTMGAVGEPGHTLLKGQPEHLRVIDNLEIRGQVNTPDEALFANIRHSTTLGFPQVKPQAIRSERVLLVGGGPSLNDTKDELVQLYFEGAKIVTLNGAAKWCLEHNLRPSAHIVLDARATNARFVDPPIAGCKYLIASQCHPDLWARLIGREDVWIFHAADQEGIFRETLEACYFGPHWTGINGGTTAATRGLALLRTLGYVRFDLFGIDSCWLRGAHHAFEQPENARDGRLWVRVYPTEDPTKERVFECAPWMMKQLEDFLVLMKTIGNEFLIQVHGDGLIAAALKDAAALQIEEDSSFQPAMSDAPKE